MIETKMRRLQLWFFRDLTDAQRLALFALNGLAVDELRNHGEQLKAFKFVFNAK